MCTCTLNADVTVAIRFEQTSYVVLESIDDITLTLSASGTFEGLINLMLETTDMTASGTCIH